MIVGNNVQPKFVIVPHMADLKIHVTAHSLEELFKNALVGMFESIEPDAPDCVNKQGSLVCDQLPQEHLVDIFSPDKESLLIDFLSEALYLSDVHSEAYIDFELHTLTQTHVKATLRGIKVLGFATEIKAVTYHDVHIMNSDDTWTVDIVFDI